MNIWENIRIKGKREHSKASEVYVDVTFIYPKSNETWNGAVPIEYRRTGICATSEEEIKKIVEEAYNAMDPKKRGEWVEKQKEFWEKEKKKAEVTKEFFYALLDFEWKCVHCQLPKNPNWARRIQDIKDMGYTLATHTNMFCRNCKKKTTHVILLALPRGGKMGYELIPPKLKKKILKVLKNYDVYEDAKRQSLLPDHKFPEIRWDEETREEQIRDMTEEEIKQKFQLMSNQRNQQKREVCRRCFQTGLRGTPFGIKFFYEGDERWPEDVPKKGKEAEKGCVGCGWYDMAKWREELNKLIKDCQRKKRN